MNALKHLLKGSEVNMQGIDAKLSQINNVIADSDDKMKGFIRNLQLY